MCRQSLITTALSLFTWVSLTGASLAAPPVPVMINPPDDAVIIHNTPTLEWSSTAGVAGTYKLQYARDVNFTVGLVTASSIIDTLYIPYGALADGEYFWRVQAIDLASDSSGYQASPFSFVVDTDPPDVILNAPLLGAEFAEGDSVDLDVTVIRPGGSPVDVWIYGDTLASPTTLLYHDSNLTSPANILLPWTLPAREFSVAASTVALWHFNENAGTTATDATGNHNGVIENAGWVTGRFGSALSFGDTDRVEILDHPDWSTPQVTVQAWVRATAFSATYNCVVTKGSYPTPVDLGYGLLTYDGQLVFLIGNAGGTSWAVLLHAMGGTTLSTDTWYHLAATYDGAHVRLYVNGVLDSNSTANPYAYAGGIHYSVGPVDIGSSLQQASADSWAGTIDEVRISGTALSAAEIEAAYVLTAGRYYWYVTAQDSVGRDSTSPTSYFDVVADRPPDITLNAPAHGTLFPAASEVDLDVTVADPEGSAVEVWIYGDTTSTPTTLLYHQSGLSSPADIVYTWGGGEPAEFDVTPNTVALWHFNENAGTTAVDATGYHHGVVQNAGWTTGRFGSGLSFGGDDRVEFSDHPDWDTPELTVQAWVNAATLGSAFNCIVTKGSYPTPVDLGYALLTYDGYLEFLIGSADGSSWAVLHDAVSATRLDTNAWYHVAATYDGSQVRLYINGELDSNGTANPYYFDGGMHYSVGPVDVGSSLQQAAIESWDGTIDEVRISDVALSAEDLRADYVLSQGYYNWYVTASDSLGNTSTSATRQFEIEPLVPVPDIPTLLEPPDLTLTNDLLPVFTWSSTAAPGGWYNLQYALDTGFTVGVQTVPGIADSAYAMPVPLAENTYYWRVQAYNSLGDSSGYPTPFALVLDATPPAAPALINPPDLTATQDPMPTFDWSASAGPGGTYTLQYAEDEFFTTNVVTASSLTDTSFTAPLTLGDTTHYWHVKAVDAAGNASGYQVDPFQFVVDTHPPDITLNAPLDGATFATGSAVDIDATVSDLGGGTVEVWVYGDTSATPTTLLLHEAGLASPADVLYTWGGGEREFTVTGNTAGLWHLNEDGGTTAGDATGSHDGVVANATWVIGRFGSGLLFGGDDRVEIPDSPDWNTPTLTVQAWVFATSLPSGYNCVLTKGTLPEGMATADLGYALLISDSGQVDFAIGNTDGSAWATIGEAVSATLLSPGVWYHLAVTYDGAYIRIYIDGELDFNGAANPYAFAGGMHYAVGPIDVGSSYQRTTADSWYGIIDEVRISGVALSDAEIKADYSLLAGRYHWYVTASDSLGHGSTTATRYFDIGTATAPAVPELFVPADLALINDDTPTFVWSSTAGTGGSYTLQYAGDPGFTTGIQTFSAITDTTYTLGSALADDTFYWRVTAIDSSGGVSGYQGAPFSFSVDTQAPDIPALVVPPHLDVFSNRTPNFVWNATAGPAGTYTLEVATDSAFVSSVTVPALPDTTHTWLVPLAYSRHYWHVRAIDEAGNESGFQPDPFVFTVVDSGGSAPPVLLSPPDSSYTCDQTPTFIWINGGAAQTDRPGSSRAATPQAVDTYVLQYATDPSFAGAVTVRDIIPPAYTISDQTPLDDTASYFWRVAVQDTAQNQGPFQANPFLIRLFAKGDQNCDNSVTASDIIAMVNYVFKGGTPPCPCEAAADLNCDQSISAPDIIRLVNYVFKAGTLCPLGELITDRYWDCP